MLDEERTPNSQQHSDAKPHKKTAAGEAGTRKTVTDPTTGKKVTIEDVNKNFMKSVQDPQVWSRV